MIIEKIWDANLDCEVTISIGQSAQENWDLIAQSQQTDLWFHLEGHPSPHVIISRPESSMGSGLSNQTLKSAAAYCKQYSKLSGLRRATVIYTEIKYVSRGDKVGSVITKKACKRLII